MLARQVGFVVLCGLVSIVSPPSLSHGLITGGEGNTPIGDPGWPVGAARAFNTPARIAWWEGPPFGGGQWHAECQGDAEKFSAFLDDFAKIEGVKRRLIVRDGVGRSFWLDPSGEQPRSPKLAVDWTLTVWQKDRWEFQKGLPRSVSALASSTDREPVAVVHLYTGGGLKASDMKVPDGVDLVDETLSAHGFQLSDGRVIEGALVGAQSKRPLSARVTLEKILPQTKGGYAYETVASTDSDSQGHWVMKQLPAGWFRVVARSDKHVPRIVDHIKVDDQPGWQQTNVELSQAESLSGRVVDQAGQPVAGAVVRLADAIYESPDDYQATSDQQGEFTLSTVPQGTATVRAHRAGYSGGLGVPITIPSEPVRLVITQAGSIRVQVRFAVSPEGGYIVNLTDARGAAKGRYGGSGNIDAEGVMVFKDVPPGKYLVSGRPNPGSEDQTTEQTAITVVGGEEARVELQAK